MTAMAISKSTCSHAHVCIREDTYKCTRVLKCRLAELILIQFENKAHNFKLILSQFENKAHNFKLILSQFENKAYNFKLILSQFENKAHNSA